MVTFTLMIASVLALTALVWLVTRVSGLSVCPICFGVSGTWAWMLAARFGGFAVDNAALAMMLGASVVGGAHWIEARLPQGRSSLQWKATALPTGFAVAYAAVTEHWLLTAAGLAALVVLTVAFLRPNRANAGDPQVVAQLEERMKSCC
jgi:hypothetical protein